MLTKRNFIKSFVCGFSFLSFKPFSLLSNFSNNSHVEKDAPKNRKLRQKFKRLSFVHICKEMPPMMRYFESDFDAIVEGTYSQLCGGKDITSYQVYMLEKGEIVNKIAWYEENQLSFLPKQDSDKAEFLIEQYNLREID